MIIFIVFIAASFLYEGVLFIKARQWKETLMLFAISGAAGFFAYLIGLPGEFSLTDMLAGFTMH